MVHSSKRGNSDRPSVEESKANNSRVASVNAKSGAEHRTTPKSTVAVPKSTQSKRVITLASSDQMRHIMAAVYFINWQRDVLKAYTKCINEFYVVPLVEHCSRKKVACAEENTQSASVAETARQLEAGPVTDEANADILKLQNRLKEAMKKISGDHDSSAHYRPVQKQKWISIAECAVMSRLKTLNQISGSLLVELQNVHAWMQKKENMTLLAKYAAHCEPCLEHTIIAFEAVCSLADIFNLQYVDRSKVKSDLRGLLEPVKQPDDGRDRNKPLEIYDGEPHPDKVKSYVKTLEARANHYRTAVYLVGVSLRDIVLVMLKSIPKEFLEVTTKDIKAILDRLPPAYRFPDEKFRLTPHFAKLLSEPPPNPRQIVPLSVRTSNSPVPADTGAASSASEGELSPKFASSSHKSPQSQHATQNTQVATSAKAHSKKSPANFSDGTQSDRSPPTARN